MSAPDLDPLLRPRSIAVIGASLTNPNNVGSRALHQLRRFSGRDVYQVHPRAAEAGDPFAVTDIAELPAAVDLLVVALPAGSVVPVVRRAAEAGVRAALIFTSGFAEGGADGERAQAELGDIAARTGMLINGPNTIGFLNLHDGLLATFYLPMDTDLPPPGPVAIVSQSGALATYTEGLARDRGIDPGWLVTTGNEAGISVTDALAYLVDRPEVEVLFAVSEGLTDGVGLVNVATRAAELGKPFVMIKAGRSEAGLAAAMSHTASISGADDVFDAVCRQYGILRAEGLEQALDWVSVLQSGRRLTGCGVGLLTGSGGGGVMMADACQANGLAVPTTPEVERAVIEQLIPSYGSALNPVDVTAQAIASGLDNYATIVRCLVESDAFDAVAISSGLRAGQELEVAEIVAQAYRATDKPMVVNWYSTNPDSRRIMTDAGVPSFPDIGRALTALGALQRFQQATGHVASPPVHAIDVDRVVAARAEIPAARGTLTEAQSSAVLERYGFPVLFQRVAPDAASAAQYAAEADRFPVAVKLVSADIPHKSDIGGVKLGLTGADGVRASAEEILAAAARHAPQAAVEGLLVQQMAGAGTELVVGLHRDPAFGPVVTVGLGGVLVEVVGEVALRRAPVTRAQAVSAISELAGGRLVSHHRGLSAAATGALADLLVRLGQLAVELPEVSEIDINPVIVAGDTLTVVDALIVTS